MLKCAIVIPIYQREMSADERVSLAQCFRVFPGRPIIFLAPEGLDVAAYRADAGSAAVEFAFFPGKFFRNIASYSRLLMSGRFYRHFRKFEYMLIYQLDAYVFRDELDAWCAKGYDYIGAPWMEQTGDGGHRFIGVGNGGLSLRRIQAFLDFGSGRFPGLFSARELIRLHYRPMLARGRITDYAGVGLRLLLKAFGCCNSVAYYAKHFAEDDFWCGLLPRAGVPLRIAPVQEAAAFSFEHFPEYLYRENGACLPFGCHAWRRHSPEFWLPFLNMETADR